jgi:hypothetical protein
MTFRIRIYSLFEEVVLHVQGGRYHFRKEISSTKDIGHNRHNALFAAIYFLWDRANESISETGGTL